MHVDQLVRVCFHQAACLDASQESLRRVAKRLRKVARSRTPDAAREHLWTTAVLAAKTPPSSFTKDDTTLLTKQRLAALRTWALTYTHGGPGTQLGFLYGATEMCCDRCRGVVKQSKRPTRRPPSDIRFWHRTLRLQGLFNVGLRLPDPRAKGSRRNHGNLLSHDSRLGPRLPVVGSYPCAGKAYVCAVVNTLLVHGGLAPTTREQFMASTM